MCQMVMYLVWSPPEGFLCARLLSRSLLCFVFFNFNSTIGAAAENFLNVLKSAFKVWIWLTWRRVLIGSSNTNNTIDNTNTGYCGNEPLNLDRCKSSFVWERGRERGKHELSNFPNLFDPCQTSQSASSAQWNVVRFPPSRATCEWFTGSLDSRAPVQPCLLSSSRTQLEATAE